MSPTVEYWVISKILGYFVIAKDKKIKSFRSVSDDKVSEFFCMTDDFCGFFFLCSGVENIRLGQKTRQLSTLAVWFRVFAFGKREFPREQTA